MIFMDTTREFIQPLDGKEKKLSRYQFMKLSLEERKRILEEQAEKLLKHYKEYREWQNAVIEYNDS